MPTFHSFVKASRQLYTYRFVNVTEAIIIGFLMQRESLLKSLHDLSSSPIFPSFHYHCVTSIASLAPFLFRTSRDFKSRDTSQQSFCHAISIPDPWCNVTYGKTSPENSVDIIPDPRPSSRKRTARRAPRDNVLPD